MSDLPTRINSAARVRFTDPGEVARGAPAMSGSYISESVPAPARVPPLKLLRFPAVRERTGLSRSTIWRLERIGEFPRHRKIAPNVVAWVEEEVSNWIRSRTDAVAS